MRAITEVELGAVAGGAPSAYTLLGELFAISHEGGVAVFMVGAAGFAGIGIGMVVNWAWEQMTGNTPGGSLYEQLNSN